MGIHKSVSSLIICMIGLSVCSLSLSGAPPSTKKTSKPIGKPWFPLNRAPSIGDKGTLQSPKILQIIDANNALVEIEWYEPGLKSSGAGSAVEANTPGRDLKTKKETIWLVTPTAGLVDGRDFESDQIFEATGTKQYVSNVGKRTVLLIEVPNEKKDKEAGYRTWMSLDNRNAFVGKLRGIKGGKKDATAEFEKKDGTIIEIPIGTLSKPDQKLIK